MNTHATLANTLPDLKTATIEIPNTSWSADAPTVIEAPSPAFKLQLLSQKDAALYSAAFAAQESNNLQAADQDLAAVTDRRLVGHVLASRYQAHPGDKAELQTWLASYSDLPQASTLYDQARRLPKTKGVKFQTPTSPDAWSGAGDDSEDVFHIQTHDAGSKAGRRLVNKIDWRLHKGDSEEAASLLEDPQNMRLLPLTTLADLRSRVAASLFYDGQQNHARQLADLALFGRDSNKQTPLALWIAGLSAWKQSDSAGAGRFFVRLAQLPNLASNDRAAAQFWAYRSLHQSGDDKGAHYWLEQASHQPHSFYGILAAGLIGHNIAAIPDQAPQLTQQNIALLASQPAGWRALALLQIDQNDLAESELRHINPQGRPDLRQAMLAIAEETNMPSLSVQLGSLSNRSAGKTYDAALYPIPKWQPEQGFQIDRALIYALIRHESQFHPQAVSQRGACGLMQLMPATATLISDGGEIIKGCSGRLMNPSHNMALGQRYVRQLASQPNIGDNLVLLLAAYNSGPGHLGQWMDEQNSKDPLLFVESLPLRETHDYVQQVMIHYWNYRARLDQPQTSLTQLAQGEWPRFSLYDERPKKLTRQADISPARNDFGFKVASNQP